MSHGPGERSRRDRRARRPASAAEDLTSAQPSADDREEDEAGLLTPRLVFVDIEEGSLDASDFDRAEDRPAASRLSRAIYPGDGIHANELAAKSRAMINPRRLSWRLRGARLQPRPPLRRQATLDLGEVDGLEAQMPDSGLQMALDNPLVGLPRRSLQFLGVGIGRQPLVRKRGEGEGPRLAEALPSDVGEPCLEPSPCFPFSPALGFGRGAPSPGAPPASMNLT